MKNSNDIIGNRTRDLPRCSAMPQPRAPVSKGDEYKKYRERVQLFVVSTFPQFRVPLKVTVQ
jgi:hypothetical protein